MAKSDLKEISSKLELTDIADPSHLQALLETFSDATHLPAVILDYKARPITFELNHCEFCREVRRAKVGVQECRASDRHGITLARDNFIKTEEPKPQFYVCRRGLVDFCAPIALKGEILAYLFGGQFRCSCDAKDLCTPDEPPLDSLKDVVGIDERSPDISALEKYYQSMDILDQMQFHEVKQKAEILTWEINNIISKLYEWRRVKVYDDFMTKAVGKQTIDELLDLMVDRLPDIIEAKHCSIFIVQRDYDEDCDRLVLRRTSYQELKPEENTAYYDKGEGLTGWVWKHKRSLRLDDLQDPAELAQPQFDDLSWIKKYNDSNEHTSFLCVPMIGRNDEVIGVIRMPHKKDAGVFTKHDDIFLNFLANHLSYVIEYKRAEGRFAHAMGPGGLVNAATELAGTRSYRQILNITVKNSLELFGRSGKRHFVNILGRTRRRWKVVQTGGELGLTAEWVGREFDADEGLTGKVINKGIPILLSDLEKAAKRGDYIVATMNGKSAISAPIQWGTRIYGAISIVSDRKFDFTVEDDLSLLESFAILVGAAMKNSRFSVPLLVLDALCLTFEAVFKLARRPKQGN